MGKVGRIVLEGILLFLIFTSIFLFLPAALFTYGGLEDKVSFLEIIYLNYFDTKRLFTHFEMFNRKIQLYH